MAGRPQPSAVSNSRLHLMSIFFALQTFIIFTAFSLERFFTQNRLGFQEISTSLMKIHALASGILSDFWMAGSVSVFITALSAGLAKIVPALGTSYQKRCFLITSFLLIIFFILNSLHIAYVDFFSSLVSAPHIKYLFDFHFMSASVGSLQDQRIIIVFFAPLMLFLVCSLWILRKKVRSSLTHTSPPIKALLPAILVVIFAPLCQVVKVQLNTQKFTWSPLNLRVNYLENLIIQLFSATSLSEPDATDASQLKAHLALVQQRSTLLASGTLTAISHSSFRKESSTPRTPVEWGDIIESPPLPADIPAGIKLNARVQERLRQHLPVYIWVVILESFRPEDGSFFLSSPAVRSYEPFYDQLAATGISFSNAWTVGGVTRAGEEGALCGLWSGEYTSAMRNLPNLNPTCSFEFVSQFFAERNHTAFWHAGRLEFDGQGVFWKRHGAQLITGRQDFPPDAPSTWWGASDLALFNKIIDVTLSRSPKNVSFNGIMTMTNHTDWHIPEDGASDLSEIARTSFHPQQATTRYTDDAIKHFVQRLKSTKCPGCEKETSLWDASVLFLTNDHGNLSPSAIHPSGGTRGISREGDLAASVSESHSLLVIQGGLVEQVLRTLPAHQKNSQGGLVLTRISSQADIFPTAMELLGIDRSQLRTPSDSLFATRRRWPVVVDLGDTIFVPDPEKVGLGTVWSRREALSQRNLDNEASQYTQLARRVFRTIQYLMQAGEAGRRRPIEQKLSLQ